MSVGVRELRQNLSVYLRRVEAGEVLRVTDRGRAVALMTPLPEQQTWRERLIAEGKLIPAKASRHDLPPPKHYPRVMSSAAALDLEREERLP